jgi:hypothetical protein
MYEIQVNFVLGQAYWSLEYMSIGRVWSDMLIQADVQLLQKTLYSKAS